MQAFLDNSASWKFCARRRTPRRAAAAPALSLDDVLAADAAARRIRRKPSRAHRREQFPVQYLRGLCGRHARRPSLSSMSSGIFASPAFGGVKVLRFSVGFGRPLWQRRAA